MSTYNNLIEVINALAMVTELAKANENASKFETEIGTTEMFIAELYRKVKDFYGNEQA